MATGSNFVNRKAEETARKIFGKLDTLVTGSSQGSWFVGQVSTDKRFIIKPDGTKLNLVFTGNPQEFVIATQITEDTAYAPANPPARQPVLDGGKDRAYALFSQYTSNKFNSGLPIMYIKDLKDNDNRNWLLPSTLLVLQPPFPNESLFASPHRFIGGSISLNQNKIVIYKFLRTETGVMSGTFPHEDTTTTSSIEFYYSIIHSYTLDDVNKLLIPSSIEEGHISYPYAYPQMTGAFSFGNASGADFWSCPNITSSFIGFTRHTSSAHFHALNCCPQFLSDGTVNLDVIGAFHSRKAGNPAWIVTVGGIPAEQPAAIGDVGGVCNFIGGSSTGAQEAVGGLLIGRSVNLGGGMQAVSFPVGPPSALTTRINTVTCGPLRTDAGENSFSYNPYMNEVFGEFGGVFKQPSPETTEEPIPDLKTAMKAFRHESGFTSYYMNPYETINQTFFLKDDSNLYKWDTQRVYKKEKFTVTTFPETVDTYKSRTFKDGNFQFIRSLLDIPTGRFFYKIKKLTYNIEEDKFSVKNFISKESISNSYFDGDGNVVKTGIAYLLSFSLATK
jgi:hypothetical protein